MFVSLNDTGGNMEANRSASKGQGMMQKRVKSSTGGADQTTVKRMLELPSYLAAGIGYYAAGRIYTPKPVHLGFLVTRKCNSKCIMCSIWKTGGSVKELALSQIREILSNPLFGSLKSVGLGGGEPTLREDLAQVIEAVLDCQPGIKRLAMDTNGLEPSLIKQRVNEIISLPAYRRLDEFSVWISIDGYEAIDEKIRRVPCAFDRVNETIQLLKELQLSSPFSTYLTCVVQPLNAGSLPQLSEFAQESKLPIIFDPIHLSDVFIDNDYSKQQLTLSHEQLEEVQDFLASRQHNLPVTRMAFWQDYFRIIQGERRRTPCALPYHAVYLDADGTLFICPADKSLVYGSVHDTPVDRIWYSAEAEERRKRAKKHFCPTCATSCNTSFSFRREFFHYASLVIREKVKGIWGK
jgi:MoaA/NifB/PqqE/SkfB family radical SAM enzyme